MQVGHKLSVAVSVLLTFSAIEAQGQQRGTCSQAPPTANVAVKASDQVFVKLLFVDNTISISVNNAQIKRVDRRPPPFPPGDARNTPEFIPINQVLNAGTNTVTLTAWNERCVHKKHCEVNPWEFRYEIVAGPNQASAGPLFSEVQCKGPTSDASEAADTLVFTHVIRLVVN
jgi:hypothetical protein